MTAKAEREARLAAQLRANLRKRKEQGRRDAPGGADEQHPVSDRPTDTATDPVR